MNELPTPYQQFIHLSRYSRWDDEKQRRETWPETVERYCEFMFLHCKKNLSYEIPEAWQERIRSSILNLEVMPSMRALWTAGPALEQEAMCQFNCAYLSVNRVRAFDELMHALMCGAGCGFSVEGKYVSKLPRIADELLPTDTMIVVADSRMGWASALRELILLLYNGRIPQWDLRKIRPAGARLKTFGGRASGPFPLDDLFHFTVSTFKQAAGRKLRPIECHDIMCKIGEIVVAGASRRAALISLSDQADLEMRKAKSGSWNDSHPWRSRANNSAVYYERPTMGTFMREWDALYESKSGERGIQNLGGTRKRITRAGRRDAERCEGSNPCNEIVLRDRETCNLSSVTIRPQDTAQSLQAKVETATVLGTIQSTITNFRYLSPAWRQNAEEERLLGVSLCGVFDNPLTYRDRGLSGLLTGLREHAIMVNAEWARRMGVNPSVAVTTLKPEGNSGELRLCANGIHPRFGRWYLRRVEQSVHDPLTTMLIDMGFPHEPKIHAPATVVFSFPLVSPRGALTRNDIDPIQHMEVWKLYQDFWAEHQVSCTIQIREAEWLKVGAWIYDNFDSVSGLSFLPHSDHIYKQAPYEEITEGQYRELSAKMPSDIDWTRLRDYEQDDQTTGNQELACTAGACEAT